MRLLIWPTDEQADLFAGTLRAMNLNFRVAAEITRSPVDKDPPPSRQNAGRISPTHWSIWARSNFAEPWKLMIVRPMQAEHLNSTAGYMIRRAWGVSRIIDGLEQLPEGKIDVKKLAVSGCSFQGKIALYASAFGLEAYLDKFLLGKPDGKPTDFLRSKFANRDTQKWIPWTTPELK